MSQPLEHAGQSPAVWCGRSWEGLADRRCAAFQHALALRNSTVANSSKTVSEFLHFFHGIGVGLFRDEEEWVFRDLRPTPRAVHQALEDHIEISGLIRTLIAEVPADSVALGVVHHLGELLENHLLYEEEEIRPLFRRMRPVLLSMS